MFSRSILLLKLSLLVTLRQIYNRSGSAKQRTETPYCWPQSARPLLAKLQADCPKMLWTAVYSGNKVMLCSSSESIAAGAAVCRHIGRMSGEATSITSDDSDDQRAVAVACHYGSVVHRRIVHRQLFRGRSAGLTPQSTSAGNWTGDSTINTASREILTSRIHQSMCCRGFLYPTLRIGRISKLTFRLHFS